MLPNEIYCTLNLFIGRKIKDLRKELGLTASELAEYIGVSQQQMSRYELGSNSINIDFLADLSDFFKVPIRMFLPELII